MQSSNDSNSTPRHNMYGVIHKGLRAMMSEVLAAIGRCDWTDSAECARVLADVRELAEFCAGHLMHENRFIHPAMEARAPTTSMAVEHEHVEHEAAIKRLRTQVEDRSIPASELSGYTISLSNFGMFAGRYATPVVVPPCVAIVGAGKLCHDVVAVMGGIEVHRRMPISLTFDHRAATGGEAARFLKALLDDLALPN